MLPPARCPKCVHSLDSIIMPHIIKDKTLDRVRNFKFLGTWISEDFKWTYEIHQVVSSCYKILTTLRRLKQFKVLKLTFKAIHHDSWPECLRLPRHNPHGELRSSQAPLLQVSLIKGTFQDVAASLFNELSPDIRK